MDIVIAINAGGRFEMVHREAKPNGMNSGATSAASFRAFRAGQLFPFKTEVPHDGIVVGVFAHPSGVHA